jgi:hypothetical protein
MLLSEHIIQNVCNHDQQHQRAATERGSDSLPFKLWRQNLSKNNNLLLCGILLRFYARKDAALLALLNDLKATPAIHHGLEVNQAVESRVV